MTINSYTANRGNNTVYQAITSSTERGFDYFGARYYASDLSVWLSVDPLADQYPSTSPYMYVLGNPIALVDPTGMNADIHITGEAAEQATEQLDASTSLNIIRDSKIGKISATGEARNENDELLLEAINNPDIDVQVNASNESNENIFGGGFMGNEITKEDAENYQTNGCPSIKKVVSKQLVNPNELSFIDKVGDTDGSGKAMLHEITESYIGAIISQTTGVSAKPARKGNPTYWIYDNAHNNASNQPPIFQPQVNSYRETRKMVDNIFKRIETTRFLIF
jgi:RHS repeat-associated protein